ncbi:MAG: hypothetical protein V1663_05670 [archaeon]
MEKTKNKAKLKTRINFCKVVLYGFLIWVILFFIGWFFIVTIPSLMHIFLLILGIILIYLFSRPFIKQEKIFLVGFVWFLINILLDLIFIVFLLNNNVYYNEWSIWVFYGLLIFEPMILKSLSK